jgi:fructose-bisphosphate aldolase class II
MGLVTSKELLQRAFSGHYAVGGFNAHNMETVRAIIEAAEQEHAPVILQLSRKTIEYAGLGTGAVLISTAAQEATVPVVLHLDHGTDVELNVRCLRAGFTSLMCDGSEVLLKTYLEKFGNSYPALDRTVELIQSREAFEENVRLTKTVVQFAHACDIPVEAELGKIPRIGEFQALGFKVDSGSGFQQSIREMTRKLFAQPEMAGEFVERTNCDSLAVACGSVHGMGEAIQPLDIDHLEKIVAKTNVPLVLHGSSGVIRSGKEAALRNIRLAKGEGTIEDAIGLGVAKVNVSTELQRSFLDGLQIAMKKYPSTMDLRKIFPEAIAALKERVVSLMRLFQCSGMARG